MSLEFGSGKTTEMNPIQWSIPSDPDDFRSKIDEVSRISWFTSNVLGVTQAECIEAGFKIAKAGEEFEWSMKATAQAIVIQ